MNRKLLFLVPLGLGTLLLLAALVPAASAGQSTWLNSPYDTYGKTGMIYYLRGAGYPQPNALHKSLQIFGGADGVACGYLIPGGTGTPVTTYWPDTGASGRNTMAPGRLGDFATATFYHWTLGDKVDLVGGCKTDENGNLAESNTVYRYNLENGQWEGTGVSYDFPDEGAIRGMGGYDQIFLAGGYDYQNGARVMMRDILMYSAVTKTVYKTGDLPQPRANAAATFGGGDDIYVFGGRVNTGSSEQVSPDVLRIGRWTGTTTVLGQLPVARENGCVFYNGYAYYLFGGSVDNVLRIRVNGNSLDFKVMQTGLGLDPNARCAAVWGGVDAGYAGFVAGGTGKRVLKYEPSTVPVTTCSLQGTQVGGWYSTAVTVTLLPDQDDVTTYYTLPDHPTGLPPNAYTGPFSYSTEGDTNITFYSKDVYGRQEVNKRCNTKIDRTFPVTAHRYDPPTPDSGSWYHRPVTIWLTPTDSPAPAIITTYYQVNGGATQTYNGATGIPLTQDGNHTVRFWSVDKAGNVETARTIPVMIDRVAPVPVVTVQPSPAPAWHRTTLRFSATCTDAVTRCASMDYRFNGGTWQPYTAGALIDQATDGTWLFEVRAFDEASHTGTASGTGRKDDSPPILTIRALPVANGRNGFHTVNATVDATDDDRAAGSGVATREWNPGGCAASTGWTAYNPSSKPLLSQNGVYTPCYRATDVASNIATLAVTTPVMLDRTGPRAWADAPAPTGDNGWHVSAPTLTLRVRDDARAYESGEEFAYARVYVGATPIGSVRTFAPNATLLVEDQGGNVNLSVQGEDRAGNVGNVSLTPLKIDLVPPSHTAQVSPNTLSPGWILGCATLSLSGDDATSKLREVRWQIDAGPIRSWPTEAPGQMCAPGSHRFWSQAVDNAGLTDPEQVLLFQVDGAVPTCTLSPVGASDGAGGWWISAPRVRVDGDDATPGSGLQDLFYRVDRGTTELLGWTRVADNATPTTSYEGRLKVGCRALDGAGQEGLGAQLSLDVDLADPVSRNATVAGTPGAGGWLLSCATVTLDATDSASGVARILFDRGASEETYSAPFQHCVDGERLLRHWAVDNASRVEGAPRETTLKVDRADPVSGAPSVSCTVGGGSWCVSDATVTLTCADVGSGVDQIRYRLDGEGEKVYAPPGIPVTTDGAHLLRYRCYDLAGRSETEKQTTVRVDKTPPAAPAVALAGTRGSGEWWVSAVGFELDAPSDGGSPIVAHRWTLSNGTEHESVEGTLVDERLENWLEAWAVDEAGWSGAVGALRVPIDLTPPNTTAQVLGTSGDGGWLVANARVELTCVDATSGCAQSRYAVDGGAEQVGTIATLGDGRHVVRYFSKDQAGLVEASKTVPVDMDAAKPDTAFVVGEPKIVHPTTGQITVGPLTSLCMQASDPTSTPREVRYSLDSGETIVVPGASACLTLAGQPGGRYCFNFWAIDRAGNVEDRAHADNTRCVTLDATAPQITVTRPPRNSVNVDGVTLGVSPLLLAAEDNEIVPETPLGLPADEFTVMKGWLRVRATATDDNGVTYPGGQPRFVVMIGPCQVVTGGWSVNGNSFTSTAFLANGGCTVPSGFQTFSWQVSDRLGNLAWANRTVFVVDVPVEQPGTPMTPAMVRILTGMDACTPLGWDKAGSLVIQNVVACVDLKIRESNQVESAGGGTSANMGGGAGGEAATDARRSG